LSATDVGLEKTQTGPATPVNSFNLGVGGYYIGEYTFTVNSFDATSGNLGTSPNGTSPNYSGAEGSGLKVGETFNSVCLSPSGDLDWSEHSYNFETFNSGKPGINPGDWSQTGIQDAAYLWRIFGNTVTTGSQGAGLAEAMYKVLYDGGSTYGSLTGTSFTPLWGSSGPGTPSYYYNQYISYYELNGGSSGPLGIAANLQTAGVLVPNPDSGDSNGSGQEFILLVPAPEPTTLIAGAAILLPFAASTLRFVRRNGAA